LKIIGIAGGSGSGKTTFAKMLTESLGPHQVTLLAQDNYYIDQSAKFDRDGGQVNFDHPSAIDWELLAQHLKLLKMHHPIEMPIYEFATHKRKRETLKRVPTPYVILDGILIFVEELVRAQMDHRIFISAREEVRFARRLKRDVIERGRTEDGVRAQYFSQVKPMHDMYVEPTSEYANHIISGEEDFGLSLSQLLKLFKA
jgi:uridine kinase